MKKVCMHYVGALCLAGFVGIFSTMMAQTQERVLQLKMQVKSEILDCPHFGTLLPSKATDVLNAENFQVDKVNKFILCNIKTPLREEEVKNKWMDLLKEINFPTDNVLNIEIYPAKN